MITSRTSLLKGSETLSRFCAFSFSRSTAGLNRQLATSPGRSQTPSEDPKNEAMRQTDNLEWPPKQPGENARDAMGEKVGQTAGEQMYARTSHPQKAVEPGDLESSAAGKTPGWSNDEYDKQTGNTSGQRALLLGAAFAGAFVASYYVYSNQGHLF